MALTKPERRARIKKRIRKTIIGSTETPRLSIYRSNKEIYAQLIDDVTGRTVASASSLGDKTAHKGSKLEQAGVVGKKIAESAKAAGLNQLYSIEMVIYIMVVSRHWQRLQEKTD